MVTYVQEKDARDFFVHVMTDLPAFGPVGLPIETIMGSAKVPRHPSWEPKRSRWKARLFSRNDDGVILEL
jgi:hypothetical protein